jgi:hypothetical protein
LFIFTPELVFTNLHFCRKESEAVLTSSDYLNAGNINAPSMHFNYMLWVAVWKHHAVEERN